MSFSIGDMVRVRQWDDMISEFGEFQNGINIPEFYFHKNMKKYCGREYKIRSITQYSSYEIVDLELEEEGWRFTSYMIEPLEDNLVVTTDDMLTDFCIKIAE